MNAQKLRGATAISCLMVTAAPCVSVGHADQGSNKIYVHVLQAGRGAYMLRNDLLTWVLGTSALQICSLVCRQHPTLLLTVAPQGSPLIMTLPSDTCGRESRGDSVTPGRACTACKCKGPMLPDLVRVLLPGISIAFFQDGLLCFTLMPSMCTKGGFEVGDSEAMSV